MALVGNNLAKPLFLVEGVFSGDKTFVRNQTVFVQAAKLLKYPQLCGDGPLVVMGMMV